MKWNVAAGSATGISHIREGLPCQDAFAHSCSGQWLVAVVCDGAGSACHSDIGANHAVETIIRELTHILDMAPQTIQGSEEFWRKAVIATVDSTRSQLKNKIPGQLADLSDYHATVIGTTVGPNYGFFFHIGDGAGFAFERGHRETCVVSPPENGEYADLTFFYTQDNWRDHLRLTFFDNSPDIVALMSDGAMSFAAAKGLKGLDPEFINPVMRYLDSVDERTGSAALEATLASHRTHTITSDDKTLLFAMKRL